MYVETCDSDRSLICKHKHSKLNGGGKGAQGGSQVCVTLSNGCCFHCLYTVSDERNSHFCTLLLWIPETGPAEWQRWGLSFSKRVCCI